MKRLFLVGSVIRAALIGVLALTAQNSVMPLYAEGKTTGAGSPGQLGQTLMGTWKLVGKPGEASKEPEAGARLKFFTGRCWCTTQADPKTGVTIFHHGGTYVLKGTEYLETVDYAIKGTGEDQLIGKTLKFTLKIEGDTLTLVGVGNPWSETWKRTQ